MVLAIACFFVTELKRRVVWGSLHGWQLHSPTQICLLELTLGNAWELVARFMIVIFIKRLTMTLLHHKGKTETNKVLEGVEIFLQSTTPKAFHFYRSCGFKQTNL